MFDPELEKLLDGHAWALIYHAQQPPHAWAVIPQRKLTYDELLDAYLAFTKLVSAIGEALAQHRTKGTGMAGDNFPDFPKNPSLNEWGTEGGSGGKCPYCDEDHA